MNDRDLRKRWASLVTDALEGHERGRDPIDNLAAELEAAVVARLAAKSNPEPSAAIADALSDSRVAEGLIDSDDSGIPWNRAGILMSIGRPAEAARDYLEAARRFEIEDELGTGLLGDERESADFARFNAVRAFANAGYLLSAAILSQRLPPSLQAEAEQFVRDALQRVLRGDAHSWGD